MSFLDPILQASGAAPSLQTTDQPVDVSAATPPNPGDVLTAIDQEHAAWMPGGGGGGGGTASAIGSTGDPINVSAAAPPVAGQVLTADDETHATWRVPGLRYDPSIKYWTSSAGSATIAPGTWGFIQQPVDAVAPVVVYIVSSLEAPPVDSRFGLYVGRDVTVPVSVNVLGASQIQGLDGVLASSTALQPGADYEWVFYHEDGAALWGLVSDTAGVAKSLRVDGGTVDITGSPAPLAGQALIAVDAAHAEFGNVPRGLMPVPGLVGSPGVGQFSISTGDLVTLPATTTEGDRAGVYALEDTAIAPPDGQVLFWGHPDGSVTGPDTITLPAGAYAEWVLCDLGEGGLGWMPGGASNEGGGAGGGGLTYGGDAAAELSPGEWVLLDALHVDLPTGPALGSRIGMLVEQNNNGAQLHTYEGGEPLQLGTKVYEEGHAVPLRAGAYYEWVLISVGEGNRWVPAAMSNVFQAPLTRSNVTSITLTPRPNEWVLSSVYGGVVNLPPGAHDGDSFAVYVDGEGCGVVPATGDSVEMPDGTDTVTSPDSINVPGGCYYEWIWIADDLTWRPRQNVLMLRPGAVASAIRDDDSTSVFDVGDKKIASVLDPVDPQDAATKAYVDANAGGYTPPYSKPPATPNAFNFEAKTAVTADLAALGFTFRRHTATAGTMVRAGEIDKFRSRGAVTAALGPLQYRSSLIKGALYIQLPNINSVVYTITKPVTVPTTTVSHGATCWGKVTSIANYNGSGHSFLHSVGLFKASGGFADSGNHVGSGYYYVNHTMQRVNYFGGSFVDNDLGLPGVEQRDIKIVTVVATTPNMTWSCDFSSSYSDNYLSFGAGVSGGLASTVQHAGALIEGGVNFTAIADSVPWHYRIDYLRLYTGDLTNIWVGDL